MRKIIATAIVWFIAVSQVYAINIEERQVFGDAVRSVRVLSTIDVDIIAPVFEDFLKSGANFQSITKLPVRKMFMMQLRKTGQNLIWLFLLRWICR